MDSKLVSRVRKTLQRLCSSESDTTSKVNYREDENQERGNWSGRLDFLLSCLGYAVGLGNVWRFPYLCYRNGGGAFLIPYIITLLLIGLPFFFMELAVGQFTSLGPVGIWNLSPVFKGIGFGMVTLNSLVCIYYNVLMAYILRYLVSSFTTRLPWATCNNTWNTALCTEFDNVSSEPGGNYTIQRSYPAEEYWERSVLEMSPGIDHPGQLKWDLCLCLLGAWIVVFLCLIKGIKSSGKVVYVTATFPYVVMVILLIRGLTLPGSANGIKFYILPDWSKLKTPAVWGDAAVQIFFSLGTSFGTLVVLASYNRFRNNCYRDALIVAIGNCLTSILAGFVIFSVIGFMAHELQLPVDAVTNSGPGLAFVVYAAGISMMPGAPFWAVLFFFMLSTLGLDSMFGMMENTLTTLGDIYPQYFRKFKGYTTAGCCLLFFLLALPQCTRGGIYWMNLLDSQGATYGLLIVALLEVIVIMHVYGCSRFCEDIEHMLGFYPNLYWRLTWKLISPMSLLCILVFTAWMHEPLHLNDYIYPPWAQLLGWLLVAFSVIWIPALAIVTWLQHISGISKIPRSTGRLFHNKRAAMEKALIPFVVGLPEETESLLPLFRLLKERREARYVKGPWNFKVLRSISEPSPEWGPALEQHRIIKCRDIGTQMLGVETCHNGVLEYNNLGFDVIKSQDVSHDTYM